MSIVGEVVDRKDRPAHVRFERVAIEDKAASLREGRYVAKDVDMAYITPPYSRDVVKKEAKAWFEDLKVKVARGRIPQEWLNQYAERYRAWQAGQEMPMHGTPIKGWGVISPATQETLLRMNILTVEDLAGINDEGIKRIGMGGADLKNKARAWLAQLTDKGPLTQENAQLQAENRNLKAEIETLRGQVESLTAQVKGLSMRMPEPADEQMPAPRVDRSVITADDVLDPTPEPDEI